LKKELLAMVEDTFRNQRLPEDFAGLVRKLLEDAAAETATREDAVGQLAQMGGRAVEPLCEAVGDPRPVIRRVAARALCRIGDARALGPVLRMLYSGDYWLHNTLFRGGNILRIPGARDELLRIARQGGKGERYWAIEALGHAAGDGEVWEFLLSLFRTAVDPKARCYPLGALCRLRPAMAPELVVEALRDEGIRRFSGWAWWDALKRGLVLPLDLCLSGFARDVAPNGRFLAALLTLRHGQAGVDALLELARSGSAIQKEGAAVALSRAGRDEAFDTLLRQLQQGGQEVKWGRILARELAHCFGGQLLRWVESPGADLKACPELAWAVAQARLAAGQATPADMVNYGTPTVRADALRKLAAELGPAALAQLRRCLADGTPKKLARQAFWSLCDLRKVAEPLALEMLTSEHWAERKAAVCLLRRWGKLTADQKARARQDPHVAVRHAADWHPTAVKAAASGHPKWAGRIPPES
jgi:HEAT repeat protein